MLGLFLKVDDFANALQEVGKADKECDQLLQTVDAIDSKKNLSRLQSLIQGIANETTKRETFLRESSGLLLADVMRDHSDARDRLGEKYWNSGQWLLQGYAFGQWKNGSSLAERVFWFRGPVGAGKRSLTSIVIQSKLESFAPSDEERFAFFYCSGLEENHSAPLAIFRSLVAQTVVNSDDYATLDSIVSRGSRLSESQCLEVVGSTTASCHRVTFVIDGLDECSDPEMLLNLLGRLMDKIGSRSRLFVSSRMNVAVKTHLPDTRTVDHGDNYRDVAQYIKTEIDQRGGLFLRGKHPELTERLINVLSRRSDGMFRWAKLQLDYFFSSKSPCKHPSIVRQKLDEIDMEIGTGLPDLSKIYLEIFKMNTQGEPLLIRHSMCALKYLALRPMPDDYWKQPVLQRRFQDLALVPSMVEIVGTNDDGTIDEDVDEDYLLDICHNLVTVELVPRGYIFKFVHKSVLEALRATAFFTLDSPVSGPSQDLSGGVPEGQFSYEANRIMAQVCLARFGAWLKDRQSYADFKNDQGFLYYAITHWNFHFNKTSQGLPREQLMDPDDEMTNMWMDRHATSAKISLKDGTKFPYMFQHYFGASCKPSRLFTAIIFDDLDTVRRFEPEYLLHRNFSCSSVGDIVIHWNRLEIMHILVGKHSMLVDYEVYKKSDSWVPQSPEAIDNALAGADAFAIEPTGEALRKDMARNKADLNVRNADGRSALMLAVLGNGSIHRLLEMGVDANAVDIDGNTCLHIMISTGRTRSAYTTTNMLRFLKGKVDANTLNKEGKSAIVLLTEWQQGASYPLPSNKDISEVVEMLIDMQASTNGIDEEWLKKYTCV